LQRIKIARPSTTYDTTFEVSEEAGGTMSTAQTFAKYRREYLGHGVRVVAKKGEIERIVGRRE